MREDDPDIDDPLPSWEDLSPAEQTDLSLAPFTLGLLIVLGLILART